MTNPREKCLSCRDSDMNENINENVDEIPKNNLDEIVVENIVNETMDEIEFLDQYSDDERIRSEEVRRWYQGKIDQSVSSNEEKKQKKEKDMETEIETSSPKKEAGRRKDSWEDLNIQPRWPCTECGKGVGRGSVKCNQCQEWTHQKCSGLTSTKRWDKNYKCTKCKGTAKCAIISKRGGRKIKNKINKEKNVRAMKEIVESMQRIARGKRRPREENTPEKADKFEKSPSKKKLKENRMHERDREEEVIDISPKNDNEIKKKHGGNDISNKSLISLNGTNLCKEDIESVNDGKYVTDQVIEFFMQSCMQSYEEQTEVNKTRERIKIIGPAMTYLLQKEDSKSAIKQHKKELNLNNHEWVIYTINNNSDPEKGDGGTHWSLLIYRKKDNKYIYFDSVKEINLRHAKELITNLAVDNESFGMNGDLPTYKVAKCKQQNNSFDCGIFVMVYMSAIISNITGGREIEDDRFIQFETEEMRGLVRAAIQEAIDRKEAGDEVPNIMDVINEMYFVGRNNDNRSGRKEQEAKKPRDAPNEINKESSKWDRKDSKSAKNENNFEHKNKIGRNNEKDEEKASRRDGIDERNSPREKCWYYMNRFCKFGNYCRREHPEICKMWLDNGRCENINDTCTLPHPTICISHSKREICYRRNCGLVHPKNRVKTNQRPQEKRTGKPWLNNKIIDNKRTDMRKDDFLDMRYMIREELKYLMRRQENPRKYYP